MKLRMGKSNKIKRWLVGGPWATECVLVPPETMVFSVDGYRGKYVYGVWQNVR
jgi:hypothetical protein